MAASQTTQHYQLPIYEPDDTTSWLTDFNDAMQKIDTAIYEASQNGGGDTPINVVQTTGDSTTNVMSQKAVTNEIISLNEALSYKQNRLESSGDNQNIKTVNGESILGKGNISTNGFEPIPITITLPTQTSAGSSIRSGLKSYIEKKGDDYFIHAFGIIDGGKENYTSGYVFGSLSTTVELPENFEWDDKATGSYTTGTMNNSSLTGTAASQKPLGLSISCTNNSFYISESHSNYANMGNGHVIFTAYIDGYYKIKLKTQ